MCNNIPLRTASFQIKAEVTIYHYVFCPVFGCFSRSAVTLNETPLNVALTR